MNWPATGCGEKGLFLWPPALAGAQRASCLSAAHGVGIRLPGSCFRPSRALQFRSQSRKLRDSSGIACLSLPRFRQGLLLSGAHGCESHRTTQGPSLLHRAPCASPSQCRDVAAPGRAQFPEMHTACRQQWPGSRVCSFPEGTPRILAPTALQHSALMAQPFPQHSPLETNKAVQECPGL